MLVAALLVPGGGSATSLVPEDIDADTRACIQQGGGAAIIGCELNAARQWRELVDIYAEQIRQRLAPEARQLFQRSQQAWQRFQAAEIRLLEQTTAKRPDGLGLPLVEGAKNQLMRDRALQLRSHLHSLRQAK